MTLIADVKTRIEAEVDELTGRIEEVADLAELVRRQALPQKSPAGFVIPLGFNARSADDGVVGLYRQMLDEVVGVVLVVEALGDPKAKRAIATIDTLTQAVLDAVCGWAPDGAIDDFRAQRGRLVSVTAGVVIYQLDFAVQRQLRITVT